MEGHDAPSGALDPFGPQRPEESYYDWWLRLQPKRDAEDAARKAAEYAALVESNRQAAAIMAKRREERVAYIATHFPGKTEMEVQAIEAAERAERFKAEPGRRRREAIKNAMTLDGLEGAIDSLGCVWSMMSLHERYRFIRAFNRARGED